MESNQQQPDPQNPAKVTFTAEQQARIDEIVKGAMGRAAAETRQQLADEKQARQALDAKLQDAQQQIAQSTEETSQLRGELQTAQSERDAERQRRIDSQKATLIAQGCLDHGFFDVETITSLVADSLTWNAEKESFEVVGSTESPDAFFAQFATRKPYLVRADIKTASGSVESSRSSLANSAIRCEHLFGRGSDSKLANEIARRDPQTYKRLKAEARAKRLI